MHSTSYRVTLFPPCIQARRDKNRPQKEVKYMFVRTRIKRWVALRLGHSQLGSANCTSAHIKKSPTGL